MSEGEKCSSSPVCQIVVPELYCDLVWKVSEGEKCSSSSVCHLVVTESCCDLILAQHDSVTTRGQTDEEEHFSLLFKGILCSSLLVCHLVLTTFYGEKCSSSSISHLLQTAPEVEKCSSSHSRPPSSDNIWIWKVVKSDLPQSATYSWQNGGVIAHWWRRAKFSSDAVTLSPCCRNVWR